MENYFDPEEKILCPYNSSHHIRRKRMNTHLVKCKKNYPDAKLVECDFNVIHKIPEPELQYHYENCPDRKKMEITVYQEQDQNLNKYPILNINVPTNETWDDYHYPTYNPKENIEKKEVLRHIDVESAAKRRDFRNSERKRLAQLVNKQTSASTCRSKYQPNISTCNEKCELPPAQTSVQVMQEDTPDSIAEIMNRIKIGSKKSFIPKA